MESLLLAFLSVLIAETGDRAQILTAALAQRFARPVPIILAIIFGCATNSMIAVCAGQQLQTMISEDPVRLFGGLAYLITAISMLAWHRKVNLLDQWKTGPFLTTFLGLFILQFGEHAQFLILAIAASDDQVIWAGIGGWLGMIAALVPAVLMQERFGEVLPLAKIRKGASILFLIYGSYLALRAWRLL